MRKRPSVDGYPSASLMGAASPLIETSGDLGGDSGLNGLHGDQSYILPSQSMINAVERGQVMHIREQTAERLVSTLQVRPSPLPAARSALGVIFFFCSTKGRKKEEPALWTALAHQNVTCQVKVV